MAVPEHATSQRRCELNPTSVLPACLDPQGTTLDFGASTLTKATNGMKLNDQ